MARSGEVLTQLALGRGTLDRDGLRRSEAGLVPTLLADPTTRVVELRGDRAAVEGPRDQPRLSLRPPAAGDEDGLVVYLGKDADAAYLLVGFADEGKHEGYAGLRAVGAQLGDRDAGLLTQSVALAAWHASHPRCPRCGAATEPGNAGWTRVCTEDGSEHYPRTDPAVIMSVVDDQDRILLARGRQWEGTTRYSVLAGFVEPGETLEDAVVREVKEEVGVDTDDVRYLGDQPWPFPASLMVGFTAHALTTELRLQDDEIATARWFTREELRQAMDAGEIVVPNPISIARRIVEHWYGEPIQGADWY